MALWLVGGCITCVPPDRVEMQSTRILKVRVEAASVIVRGGGLKGERKDFQCEETFGEGLDGGWRR